MLVLVISAGSASAQQSISLGSLDAYGTIHAGGVVATVSGDDDWDAAASLEWRELGGTFAFGYPLTRVDDQHFVGSLFWLDPSTSYEVRVSVADPDGVTGSSSTTASFSTRSNTLAEPTLRTLYVAPGGDDGNLGTNPAAPLETVQRAADLATAGDLILIAPGVYRENVSVGASGTAAQPIVFRGTGTGVILDGADESIAEGVSWNAGANNVYSRVTGFATGHVATDQGRLFRYDNLTELTALGAGAPGGFFFDGTTLYLKLSSGAPTDPARTIHVARRDNGFYLNGRAHVRIENIEIRYFGSSDYGKGVYLRYSDDCAVRSCLIHEVGSACVWVKGGSRNLVELNQLWDTSIFNWPWDFTKGSSSENNAVVLTDDVGRGNVVRSNTIWGVFNGIGPCGGDAPPSGFSVETDLYDNQVRQITDDAFEPEGYCSNVRLWENTVTDAHMAFAVAPAAPGPTYFVRNIAYNTGNTRTSQVDGWIASALKINSGYSTPVGPLHLLHNTLLTEATDTDAIVLMNPGNSTSIYARNNIIAGTRYVLDKVNPVSLDWDNDLLSTTDTGRFVYWEGSRYYNIAELTAATSQESSGIEAAPDLVDPANGDFTPGPSSQAIDNGVVIPGINDGYSGLKPDIGAVEVPEFIFTDGFESGGTTQWSASSP